MKTLSFLGYGAGRGAIEEIMGEFGGGNGPKWDISLYTHVTFLRIKKIYKYNAHINITSQNL